MQRAALLYSLGALLRNGVSAKTPVESAMLFQDGNLPTGPREQITSHHLRRSAAYDHTTSLQFFRHTYCGSIFDSKPSGLQIRITKLEARNNFLKNLNDQTALLALTHDCTEDVH